MPVYAALGIALSVYLFRRVATEQFVADIWRVLSVFLRHYEKTLVYQRPLVPGSLPS